MDQTQQTPVAPSTDQTQNSVQPASLPATPIVSPQNDLPGSMAQPIVQATANAQPEPVMGGSSKAKEAGSVSMEVTPTIEVVGTDAIEKEPLPPEVASWMEKVNRDNSGEKPPEIVVADQTANEPTGSYSNQPVFVLPLGDATYKMGLHSSVNDSVRWLSEWCKRLVKKLGNQVTFSN